MVFLREYWWFWCCHFVKIMKHARFPRKYWWFYDFKNQENRRNVPGCPTIIILREYYSTTTTINPLGVGATYLTHPHTYAWQLPPGGILSPLFLWSPSPRHPALFRQETTYTPMFGVSTASDDLLTTWESQVYSLPSPTCTQPSTSIRWNLTLHVRK